MKFTDLFGYVAYTHTCLLVGRARARSQLSTQRNTVTLWLVKFHVLPLEVRRRAALTILWTSTRDTTKVAEHIWFARTTELLVAMGRDLYDDGFDCLRSIVQNGPDYASSDETYQQILLALIFDYPTPAQN